jgi:hypothetical protein
MKTLFFGLFLALALSACDNQKITGIAPSVTAQADAPEGKTRATAIVRSENVDVRGRICDENGGGLVVEHVDRQTAKFTNLNQDCTWLSLFAAYGVPPGATDTAQQHWLAGVYLVIPAGQSRPMTIAYSECRDRWTVGFQTDAWALRQPPLPTDQPLPKQFNQGGIGLHEFGGQTWKTEDCSAPPPNDPPVPPTPPVPPPQLPTCATDKTLCQPAPPQCSNVLPLVVDISGDNNWLYQTDAPTIGPLPMSIPKSFTYKLVAATWDDHDLKRDQTDQTQEIAIVKFYHGAQIVGQLGPTLDIPNDVNDRTSPLGDIAFSADVTAVVIEHAGSPANGPNSFKFKSLTATCAAEQNGAGKR